MNVNMQRGCFSSFITLIGTLYLLALLSFMNDTEEIKDNLIHVKHAISLEFWIIWIPL